MPIRPSRLGGRGARVLEGIARDVRHVARGLRKSVGFTIAVVLTLALGIGGNAAIFSVIDQLLLRPLPYPNGEELLTIYESFQRGRGQFQSGRRNSVSPANWLDWQRESRTIRTLAAREYPACLLMVSPTGLDQRSGDRSAF